MGKTKNLTRYPEELRARAVRIVLGQENECPMDTLSSITRRWEGEVSADAADDGAFPVRRIIPRPRTTQVDSDPKLMTN
jgi:hypothetical protein